jgi:signal transduction histidine kinase
MRVERTAGHEVLFVVEDDGPGIPVQDRERVFERFHRTDRARDRATGGAGLGLAIVRGIVEAHGGRVSASQSPEGGARIEIQLGGFRPSPQPAEARAESGLSTGAPARGQLA